jgi:hypothetical protein
MIQIAVEYRIMDQKIFLIRKVMVALTTEIDLVEKVF